MRHCGCDEKYKNRRAVCGQFKKSEGSGRFTPYLELPTMSSAEVIIAQSGVCEFLVGVENSGKYHAVPDSGNENSNESVIT